MAASPDRFSIKRLWRRPTAPDSNKDASARDMPGNTPATPGNAAAAPQPPAGFALPPLVIAPDMAGATALTALLAPTAVWLLTVWIARRMNAR